MNGWHIIGSKKHLKKYMKKIIKKRKRIKKKKMINILNIKVWIMLLYWHINKRRSLKLYKKYKWVRTFHKPGIIFPTLAIIIMATVFTFVNFVLHFSILKNNWKDIHKNVHYFIRQVIKCIETNNKKWQYFKLMD